MKVSQLWKLAENLIDFGGKGHRVVRLNKDSNLLVTEDPKQKLSFSWLASTLLKISLLSLTYMSVVGGIAHLGVIAYNRKKYSTTAAMALGTTAEHAKVTRGSDLGTAEAVRKQFTKDYNRNLCLALNGEIIEKIDLKQGQFCQLSDFPSCSQFGVDENLFEKVQLFSQQGSQFDAIVYIKENFPNTLTASRPPSKGEKVTNTVADITNEGGDMILRLTFPLTFYNEAKYLAGIKEITAQALFTKEVNLSNENKQATLSLSEYQPV